MDDLISRSAAIEALTDALCMTGYQSRSIDAVRSLPAIGAEPVRHGHYDFVAMRRELSPGKYITCCGGQRGLILLSDPHRILIMCFGEGTRISFVCGLNPIIYKDEVQWDHGNYFTPWTPDANGQALAQAAQYYEGMEGTVRYETD